MVIVKKTISLSDWYQSRRYGTLLIAYLTQKDIDEVNDGGIMCRIRAGSTFEDSGKLSLEKNPLQKGRE